MLSNHKSCIIVERKTLHELKYIIVLEIVQNVLLIKTLYKKINIMHGSQR